MRTISTLLAILLLAAMPAALFAQGNAKEIMSKKPAELVDILKNDKATLFEKAKACQRLAVVGDKDAIPALAALLPDEKLNVYARTALENIPGPEAAAALREAAGKLTGRQLIGVLDSLGQMRDEKAMELLRKYLDDKDPAVTSAAAGALGRIGTPLCADALTYAIGADAPFRLAAADAALDCAKRLEAAGQKDLAEKVYGWLLHKRPLLGSSDSNPGETDLPDHVKDAALFGLLRLKKSGDTELLVSLTSSPNKSFFKVALKAIREIPGKEITEALVGELDKLPPQRRALVLMALADRADQPPLAVVEKALADDSPEVREAAVYALVKRGDAAAAGALMTAAMAEGQSARQAIDGLKTLPGKDIDKAILDRLPAAKERTKAVFIELIGARRIAEAAPVVRESLSDKSQPVRLAALAALAQLATLDDIDLLAERAFASGGEEEIAAARSALRTAALRTTDREACAEKLAARLQLATAANQEHLLVLLGELSGKKALETVIASVKSDNEKLKDAATRVLGEWPNADAAAALLELAKTDAEAKYRIRALRGYIRIARQLQLPDQVRLVMFRAAMDAAERDDERRLALDVLTRIPSETTLSAAVSHLGNAALKDAAAEAAVKIAAKLAAGQPQLVAEAMKKVIDAGVGGQVGERAKQLLEQTKTP
jgi:HEAT repeat protein